MSVMMRVNLIVPVLVLAIAFYSVFVFASEQDNQVKDYNTVSYLEFCERCDYEIETLQQLVKKKPESIKYKIWLGNLYVENYHFAEAIDLANEIIAKHPSCGLAYTLLALAKIQDRRFPDDAIWYIDYPEPEIIREHLKKAMTFSPNDMLPKVLDCSIESWLGNREKALQTIEGYLSKKPESTETWLWKGNIYFDSREDNWDLIRANECYVRIKSQYPKVKKQLGLWAREMFDELFLERINNKDKDFDESALNYALPAARIINLQLCDQFPNDYLPYYSLGCIYGRVKSKIQDELKYYTLSLEKRETLAAYSMRSQVYQNLKEIDNAKKDIARGVEIAADRVKLCEYFLEIALNTGNTDLALWWTDECIRIEPKNGDLYNIRGIIYIMKFLMHDTKDALEMANVDFKKAVELGAPEYYGTSVYRRILGELKRKTMDK